MLYVLSCEIAENSGGIYGFDLIGNGALQLCAYFPCDKPMYAVRCKKGLCVLFRQPFEKNQNSGYFFIDENLQTASEIIDSKGQVACHLYVENEDVYHRLRYLF